MFIEQTLRILVVAISLVIAFYWIVSLGNLAWFHPEKLEKIMSERARHHPMSVYNPKYNWQGVIWMARLFSLAGILVLLVLVVELALGIIGFIK